MAGDGGDPETSPLLKRSSPNGKNEFYIKLAIRGALGVNVLLFSCMVATFIASKSLAVLASLLDNALDLLSQSIIWYGYKRSQREDERYPVGTSRLSPVGILVCSTLMFAGAVQVIWESAVTFGEGLGGRLPTVEFDCYVVAVLMAAVCVKVVLLCYSRFHPACVGSPDVQTMAQDHFNDILTNAGALSCGFVAAKHHRLWWIDPIGAIVLALYIAYSWYCTGHENLQKLVGLEADEETTAEVLEVVGRYERHRLKLDTLKCYHLGNNVVVEVDVVMPGEFLLHRTHDIALQLQQELEQLPMVERAYVHTDYKCRAPTGEEHAVTPPLWLDYACGRHKRIGGAADPPPAARGPADQA